MKSKRRLRMELPEIKSDLKLPRKHYQEFIRRYQNMTPEQKQIPGELSSQLVIDLKQQVSHKLTPKKYRYLVVLFLKRIGFSFS